MGQPDDSLTCETCGVVFLRHPSWPANDATARKARENNSAQWLTLYLHCVCRYRGLSFAPTATFLARVLANLARGFSHNLLTRRPTELAGYDPGENQGRPWGSMKHIRPAMDLCVVMGIVDDCDIHCSKPTLSTVRILHWPRNPIPT